MCNWRHYLEGVRFTLVTDHRALLWLFCQPHLRGKLARWALDRQQFEFDVTHRPGKFHFVPDAVSRLRRLDEFENNDEQNLQTDEVGDKAFELGNVASLTCVAVVQCRNDFDLLDESLEFGVFELGALYRGALGVAPDLERVPEVAGGKVHPQRRVH